METPLQVEKFPLFFEPFPNAITIVPLDKKYETPRDKNFLV